MSVGIKGRSALTCLLLHMAWVDFARHRCPSGIRRWSRGIHGMSRAQEGFWSHPTYAPFLCPPRLRDKPPYCNLPFPPPPPWLSMAQPPSLPSSEDRGAPPHEQRTRFQCQGRRVRNRAPARPTNGCGNAKRRGRRMGTHGRQLFAVEVEEEEDNQRVF